MLELPRVERVPCYWRRVNRFEPKANLRAPPVCIKKEPWRGQAEPSPLWQLNHHCQNTNRTPRTSRLVVNKLLSRHGCPPPVHMAVGRAVATACLHGSIYIHTSCKYSNSYMATIEHSSSSSFTNLMNSSIPSSDPENTNTQQHGFQAHQPMIFPPHQYDPRSFPPPFYPQNFNLLESNQVIISSLPQTITIAFLSMAISMGVIWLPIHHHHQVHHLCLQLVLQDVRTQLLQ